jgi:hypothetical protein
MLEITKENKQDRQNLLPLSMPEADRPYIIYMVADFVYPVYSL